jgi:endo-1,4-beta-xylanase
MGKEISRRDFLSGIGATVAGIGAFPAADWANDMTALPADSPDGIPLRDHAASKGLLYGGATPWYYLRDDPQFADAFAKQCGLLVPEDALKWHVLRKSIDTFNFPQADWLYAFTQQHQMKFRGHALVDHGQMWDAANTEVTAANAKDVLLTHIATVAGRFAGKVQSWDVVNEVIYPEDKRDDGLRANLWLQTIGPEYIEMAFHAAAQADPHALLVWNTNWMEEDSAYGDTKRAFLLQHVQELLRRQVPIQAIGLQSHLVGDHTNIAGPRFQTFLHQISDMGLKILITELDVSDVKLPGDVATRDQTIASIYYNYLSTVVRHKSVVAVITWGLSNRYSWISKAKPRKDGLPPRPLPLDANMNPTPVFNAIARAFDEAPNR